MRGNIHRILTAAILAALLFLTSCETPAGIARFCSSAVVTLKSGDALFDDMKGSCVRVVQSREAFGTFTVTDPNNPACDNIGKQAAGLKAASAVVAAYFSALNDLASFGTSKAGEGVGELVTKVSTQAGLDAPRQKAIASIGSFLTRVATTGYQQKELADDIVRVHSEIHLTLDGLGEAIGLLYAQQLESEEDKTAARYREFLLEHPNSAEAILTLDGRWETDRAALRAKLKSASSYQSALATLAKAHDELAAHVKQWKAGELPDLLLPYAAQLESLVPAIQKGFF